MYIRTYVYIYIICTYQYSGEREQVTKRDSRVGDTKRWREQENETGRGRQTEGDCKSERQGGREEKEQARVGDC